MQKLGVDDVIAAGMTFDQLQAYVRDLDELPVVHEPELPLVDVASVQAPLLPSYALLSDDLAAQGSPWLDTYVRFSRQWSPQSYEGFHVAIALWLLSVIAARRVVLDHGRKLYTNLYIALCARTSLFAKSTAASIAIDMLEVTGLTHLLAPDDASPQAFLRGMTLRVPEGFAQAPANRQLAIRLRLMFAAQKGWFYDEFGQKLHAMMQHGGTMADFRGHLRRLDDCPSTYEYVTISRGSDLIEGPYLALLASLTPADLKPHARKGSALWGDGFLARFALVAPPADLLVELEDFPEGERIIPPAIVQPLRAWHERLGLPQLSIVERTKGQGEGTGSFDVELTPVPPQRCVLGDGVRAAVSAYRKALHDILQASDENIDLDGNYARLHNKALRIAMLLASLENGGRIELRHWARAQQITERWRVDLHHLVAQLGQDEPSRERAAEDRIMAFLVRQADWVTPRIVAQHMRNLSSGEIKTHLERMAAVGRVTTRVTKHTTRYRAVGVGGVDGVDVLNGAETVYTSPPPPAPPAAHQLPIEGVDSSKGVSTPSTLQHLQHPPGSDRVPSPRTPNEPRENVVLPPPDSAASTEEGGEEVQGLGTPDRRSDHPAIPTITAEVLINDHDVREKLARDLLGQGEWTAARLQASSISDETRRDSLVTEINQLEVMTTDAAKRKGGL